MVANTRKSGNSPKKLKFHEKLVGKGLTTDALLKKLKALHEELADMDQDHVDLKSLNPVCKELISTSVLLHKDRGVKAFAACCLADLLRLFAPDAPYLASELRDIFQFFFKQLQVGLKGIDSLYYNQYFHLLESLSTVKSVVLVCDLPQADELMVQIFRDFFVLVRQDLATNIEMFMSDILVALIDESQSVPSDVLDTLMVQFSDKNAGMDQPAYRLAVEVCNHTADKLQRHVNMYLTDHIVQHSQNEDYDEIRKVHELIKRINRSCSALLHNVVPQLEEELKVEELQIRQMATQVLGEMFAERSGEDLERRHPSTWQTWLARMNDKSPIVRLAFVESCKGLLTRPGSDMRDSIERCLEVKLCDPDEKIRAATCKLYSQLDYDTALHRVSEKQLRAVGDRTVDKKQSVRHEALMSLGKLYSLAYPEIESREPPAIKQFSWIPQQILQSVTTTLEVKAIAEQALADFILPPPGKTDDEVAWTDRLLTTMEFLDEKAIGVLISLSGVKTQRPSILERFLECCIANNGGVIDEDEENIKRRLAMVTRVISRQFPDPIKITEDMQKFAKMNEQRLYKLFKTCMDPQSDIKTVVKSSKEFTRRIEESSSTIAPTMISLLRQGSLWTINQSSVPTLIKRLQTGDPMGTGHGTSQAQLSANNAQAILTTISKHCPAMLQPHVAELVKAIAEEENPRLVEVCLQALAAVSKWDPGLTPSDKRTIQRLQRCVYEVNPRHAKFAARLLANAKKSEELCEEIIDSIAERISGADPDALVALVAVLNELVVAAPDAFERKSEEIMRFLVKQVIMEPIVMEENSMDTDDDDVEWAEENALPAMAKAKILSLKVCRRRCLAHAQSETGVEVATPVVKMLHTLLDNGGSIGEDSQEDPKIRSRIRLQAAWSLLQLATVDKLADLVAPYFVTLALTVQDTCFNVRLTFLTKLIGLLHAHKLHPRYYLLPFLTVHDPEDEIKDKARNFVAFAFRSAPLDFKLSHYEMIFIRLLHLLAHHPDFGTSEEQLREQAKYINLYLDVIATADNLPLLYHLAQKAKTVRDAESYTHSENLYIASELAQDMMQKRAKAHGWSLTSYPGKVKLPSDIFRPLPNAQAANQLIKTVYLPEETLQLLDKAEVKEKPKAERKATSKKKPQTNGGKPKRKRTAKRQKRDSGDSDDDDDDDDVDDSDVSEVLPRKRTASRSSSPLSDLSDVDDTNGHPNAEEDDDEDGPGTRTRAKARAKKKARRKARQSDS